jgi:hypothetical protein
MSEPTINNGKGANVHQQVQGTINNLNCPHAGNCPWQGAENVPKSFIAEQEIARQIGLNLSIEGVKALDAFRERHRLSWIGDKSIKSMMREAVIFYDNLNDKVIVKPSLPSIAFGWASVAVLLLVTLGSAFGLIYGKPTDSHTVSDNLLLTFWGVSSFIIAYFLIRFILATEIMGWRIYKKEQQLALTGCHKDS